MGFGMFEEVEVASICCLVCGNGHGSAFLYREVENRRCKERNERRGNISIRETRPVAEFVMAVWSLIQRE